MLPEKGMDGSTRIVSAAARPKHLKLSRADLYPAVLSCPVTTVFLFDSDLGSATS